MIWQPIYLICGVPGSGKTWVCNQVADKFHFVPQENFISKDRTIAPNHLHREALLTAATKENKPVIGECPFMISIMINELKARGADVRPVFVLEPEHVVKMRYERREVRPIPKQHLTRVATVRQRARQYGIFSGSSDSVLQYLKDLHENPAPHMPQAEE